MLNNELYRESVMKTFPDFQLQYKSSYGNHRYYPDCEVSQVVADLMKVKSFTASDINLLRKIYTVNINHGSDDPFKGE